MKDETVSLLLLKTVHSKKKKKKLKQNYHRRIPSLCTQMDRKQKLKYTYKDVQSALLVVANEGGGHSTAHHKYNGPLIIKRS